MVKKINKSYLNAGKLTAMKGVVIHNDAGSINAVAEWYVSWVPTRNLELGIAHYYIDRFTIARLIDTFKVGWHTGSQEGNYNYIGYEVCQSAGASDKDFLANEDMTLMQAAEDLKFYGLPANHNTVRLHHEFVPTDCPHRSMALHGGTTQSTKDYFVQRINYFMSLGNTVEEMIAKHNKPKKASAKPSGTFKVETVNRKKGEFALRLSNIKSPDGIAEVLFPTWTDKDGQDDIKWHKGVKQPDGSFLFATSIKDHGGSLDDYTVHAYIKTPDGAMHGVGSGKFNVNGTAKGSIKLTQEGSDVYTVEVSGIKYDGDITGVLFPTWSSDGGQNDLVWYEGHKHSDGSYTFQVYCKDHGNKPGEYVTHVYLKNGLGGKTAIGGITFKKKG